MYSYNVLISLDGFEVRSTHLVLKRMTRDEVKLEAFIGFYQDQFEKQIEFEASTRKEFANGCPSRSSQLRGETMEAFKRAKFRFLDGTSPFKGTSIFE